MLLTLAALFIMIISGYLVSIALIPSPTIQLEERVLISFGISLLLTIIGGFVLNSTPWGIVRWSLIAWYGGFSILSYVKFRLIDKKHTPSRTFLQRFTLDIRTIILFTAAIILSISAYIVSARGAETEYATAFSQLWMLPITPGDNNAVRLGVQNEEGVIATYRIELRRNDTVVFENKALMLQPGERWEITIELNNDPDDNTTLRAYLYYPPTSNQSYRYVALWDAD